ncbi:MAG: hypothetical protein MSC30_17610 [Gaiellaceae bacterium MAG52_C11]|nr:hypothetical protein [Candidatus Gaiellasilicea maunaloa]
MSGFERKVAQLAWDSTGRWLATGGGTSIAVWDCVGKGPEGRKPRQLDVHTRAVSALSYAPARPVLASGGDDGRIAIWQPDIRKRPVAVLETDAAIACLAWSPDGLSLAAADADGGVHVLQLL